MKFTIHRGTSSIGGSCVEVSTSKARIIIDAGLPLEDWRKKVRSPLPTQVFPATDPRALNVPGLFQHGPPVGGIFLSHAHADHSGLLCQTDPSVQVYLSKGTSKMLKAGSIFAGMAELDRKRQKELKIGVPIQIGDIKVTPYNVDHSAFDAMAFLIEADGKRLLYTGDFRLHGRKPGMGQTLIKQVSQASLEVLILEGTHFSNKPAPLAAHQTEEQLQLAIEKAMRATTGLVFASFSPQNVDRLVTFYKAALKCNRLFVADVYTAYVLHVVHGQCRSIPKPEPEAGIRVFYNEGFTRKLNWEAVAKRFRHSCIDLDEIHRRPDKFTMVFRPSMLRLDFKEPLPPNSSCIYSYWHGYLGQPEWTECQESLASQMCAFAELHTSGHVFVEASVIFVERINPNCVVPIHTQAPETYPALFPNTNVRLLTDGEEMEVR